jgi:hypothetical protein
MLRSTKQLELFASALTHSALQNQKSPHKEQALTAKSLFQFLARLADESLNS